MLLGANQVSMKWRDVQAATHLIWRRKMSTMQVRVRNVTPQTRRTIRATLVCLVFIGVCLLRVTFFSRTELVHIFDRPLCACAQYRRPLTYFASQELDPQARSRRWLVGGVYALCLRFLLLDNTLQT